MKALTKGLISTAVMALSVYIIMQFKLPNTVGLILEISCGAIAYKPTAAGKGWKNALVTWYQKFKESVFFRKLFLLTFVTSMILFRTLLNRNLWMKPLSDVMGGWGIWETVNGEQKLTTECMQKRLVHKDRSACL